VPAVRAWQQLSVSQFPYIPVQWHSEEVGDLPRSAVTHFFHRNAWPAVGLRRVEGDSRALPASQFGLGQTAIVFLRCLGPAIPATSPFRASGPRHCISVQETVPTTWLSPSSAIKIRIEESRC